MEIVNLYDYIEENNKYSLIEDLFEFMNDYYKKFYPGFGKWYREKVVQDFLDKKREILIVKNDHENIYGVSIVKFASKPTKNNKICSFYISSEIKNEGYGTELLLSSLEYLNNQRPFNNTVITVPEERLRDKNKKITLENFLIKNNFKIIAREPGKYRSNRYEYILMHDGINNKELRKKEKTSFELRGL
ncbi:MAG: hypothetical protein ACYDA4_09160 [Ignavibacteriaceae bacterium]